MISFQFEAIGTQWQIDISSPISENKLNILKSVISKRIEIFDKAYSRFRADSWVTKNAYKICVTKVPEDFQLLFELYQKLYVASNRLFTPLIGSVMEQAGYDKNYSLQPKELTVPPQLSDALFYENKILEFKDKVLLDFGAAGKGYLVDIISKILEQEKISSYCIDASGDILHKSSLGTPIRVGLEHPDDPTIAIGVCELLNMSICGSSGSRRKWGKFHHTISPLTLESPQEIKAVWVVAKSTILADALATCLFLDPNIDHYKNFKFECVLLYKDSSAYISQCFPGALFTS